MSLIPCPSCHRHARADESCPFCGSVMVPSTGADNRAQNLTGARRAAVIAVSAALASTAFLACGDDTAPGGGGSGGNGGGNGGETTDGGANAGGGGANAGGGGESAGGGGESAGGGGASAGGGGAGEGGNIAPPYGSPPF